MPRGGARPGAGRKPGVKNRANQRLLDALEAAQADLVAARADAAPPPMPAEPPTVVRLSDRTVEKDIAERFGGDAHDVLKAVYQSEDLPLDVRVDAAKAALPYEKPRLAAVAVKVDDRQGFLPLWDWMEAHADASGALAESLAGESESPGSVRH